MMKMALIWQNSSPSWLLFSTSTFYFYFRSTAKCSGCTLRRRNERRSTARWSTSGSTPPKSRSSNWRSTSHGWRSWSEGRWVALKPRDTSFKQVGSLVTQFYFHRELFKKQGSMVSLGLFLCTFEKTQGQNNSIFSPLAKSQGFFLKRLKVMRPNPKPRGIEF